MYPNDVQATYFVRACGVARFAWNWALAEWKRMYEAGEQVSEAELRKKLNAVKRREFPWMLGVTKCAPQLAIKDLGVAFENFFKGRTGFPNFKKKAHNESFRISNDQFVIEGRKIRIPNLGWVRLAEELRFGGEIKILGAAISRLAAGWYVSVQVKMADREPIHDESGPKVGLRLSDEAMVTLSDGSMPGELPKEHGALLLRARRLKRSLSRKVGGDGEKMPSRNFRRAQRKLERLQTRLANVRNDALHKVTTKLTRTYGMIEASPEFLQAQGKRRKSDPLRPTRVASAYEFRRQLEYKAKITGSRLSGIRKSE
jgi:putative transposase